MKASFAKSMSAVLVHEGGFVNHPKDPGGATMQGVTQRVYDNYRKGLKKPAQSVRKMVSAERDAIYRKQYWQAAKCDSLPVGVDYVVFDGAVNSGVSQSVKWLQRALGNLYNGQVDGLIGPTTLDAVARVTDYDVLIAKICERRMAFLKALKTWRTFGKGWTARVAGVKRMGQAMATGGGSGYQVAHVEGGSSKALIQDAKSPPSKAVADLSSGVGIGGGALTQSIDEGKGALSQVVGVSVFVDNLYAILSVASVVLVLGGLGYRWYAARKKKELADALDLQTA